MNVGLGLAGRIFPANRRRHELAVDAQRFSVGQHVVPNEAGGRVGHRVAARVGIAPRKAGERLFQVVGNVRFVRPLMPVGARVRRCSRSCPAARTLRRACDDSASPRDRRCTDSGSPSPFSMSPNTWSYVRFSLMMYSNMLEHRRLAVPLRHGPRRDVGPRRRECADRFRQSVVFKHGLRVRGQFFGRRQLEQRERSLVIVRVVAEHRLCPDLPLAFPRTVSRSVALHIGDV